MQFDTTTGDRESLRGTHLIRQILVRETGYEFSLCLLSSFFCEREWADCRQPTPLFLLEAFNDRSTGQNQQIYV